MNQKLAVGLLTRAGHRVGVANNGREALAAIEAQQFDLVLMDVQMPELDGLDATPALRERERTTGRPRLAVIAMTAHAMPGDRERCLAAGMDSYISKPIRSRDLFAVIAQVVRDAAPADNTAVQPLSASVEIDWSAALETVGGDRALLLELVDAFLQEAPRLLADLRHAAEAADAAGLRIAAHTLKASLRYLGANKLYAEALAIETAGRAGNLAGIQEIVAAFDRSLESLLTRLPEIVARVT